MRPHSHDDKWDALAWRATVPARRALQLARDHFRDRIAPAACHADIQLLARELPVPAAPAPPPEEILRGAVAWGRLYPGRYAFYAQAPAGYDVAAVLRIERSHLRTYLLSPLFLLPEAEETLGRFAADRARLAQAVRFLLQEHHNTDMSRPRQSFGNIRREHLIVREALEAWHAAL